MPSITWLHLSDLHACNPRTGWDAGRVLETLLKDLARLREQHGLAPELLFFTGDAAWGQIGSGEGRSLAEQFQEFGSFLDGVRETLDPAFPWENVFIVPGNHDVDRTQVSRATTRWLDPAEMTLPLVEQLIRDAGVDWRQVMLRQTAYRSFVEDHGRLEHLLGDRERLIYSTRKQNLAGLNVGIAGFNTAWSCCESEAQGRLWMGGRWQNGTLRRGLEGCDFTIALLHHPPDWLALHEKSDLAIELENDYQFLLHGHEHTAWVKPLAEGHTTVAAGACYESSHMENGYNLVRLDLETGEAAVWLRRYQRPSGWVACPIPGKTDDRGVWTIRPPWLQKLRRVPVAKKSDASKSPEAVLDPLDGSERLERYLWRLRAAHRDLPVAGFETRVRLPIRLDQVYVPLRARLYRQALEKDAREFGAHSELLSGAEEDRDLHLRDAPALARRFELGGLVIIGDPGSGKTTLLKHYVLAALDTFQGGSDFDLPTGMLPVFIALRSVKNPAAGLEPALTDALKGLVSRGTEARLAKELIERDRLFVLIDGLDEVADDAQRAAVSRWVEEALVSLPRSLFAVTSRYAGYKGNARLDGRFLELHVRDLEEPEARRFITRWYSAVETQVDVDRDPERAAGLAEAGAADLTRRLFESDEPRVASLRRLARNPLMLQILCLVHRDRKTLPEGRVELYGESLRVLLQLWREAKGLPVSISARDALKILQPLAWWLQTSARKEATLEEIRPLLELPLRELGAQASTADEILATLRDQSGALVYLGQKSYAFLHLSFQEYLAARHVQNRYVEEPPLLLELASHFGDEAWREVILVAAGLDNPCLFKPLLAELLRQGVLHKDAALADAFVLDAHERSAAPVLDALASRAVARPEERHAALRLLKSLPSWDKESSASGSTARDILIALANDKSEEAPVRGLASELLGGREALSPRPVRVHQPQPGEERIHPVDGSVLVYVPGGQYTIGSDTISDRERPIHAVHLRPFWIGKYPVMNEQYERFQDANPRVGRQEHWYDKRLNPRQHPAVGVSWHDARAYCRWAGLALPSEAQWEAAARGTDQRRFPWGTEDPTPSHANFGGNEGSTTPVGAFPAGAGPFGTQDQAGNVWEWCADGWDLEAYRKRRSNINPTTPVAAGEDVVVALRGGSWDCGAASLAAAHRSRSWAWSKLRDVGFRCVLVSSSEHD